MLLHSRFLFSDFISICFQMPLPCNKGNLFKFCSMHKKILLIDDDEDEQFFFLEALKELNVPVKFFFASNATEGYQLLEYVLPDIVFIDINMPLINGFECLDTIMDNKPGNQFTAIIYSTGVDHNIRNKAIKKGASACIKKQGTIHDLVNILKNLL